MCLLQPARASLFPFPMIEFMEMYAGIGASRVRDMFQQARAAVRWWSLRW